MATQTRTPSPEQAAERITEINEQVIEFGRKAGSASSTRTRRRGDLRRLPGQRRRLDQIDWVADIARAQANFTREVIGPYTSIGRELLK